MELVDLARGSTVTLDPPLGPPLGPPLADSIDALAVRDRPGFVHARFDVGRISAGLDIRRDLGDLANVGRALDVSRSAAAPSEIDASLDTTLRAGSATQRSRAATLRVRSHEGAPERTPDQSAPAAIVTESAEAVYINERHDTIEAPPLARELFEADAAARRIAQSPQRVVLDPMPSGLSVRSPEHRPTEPTAPVMVREAETIKMSAIEAQARARAAFADDTSADDARRGDVIARQRGSLPLRLRTWTTRTSTALARTTRSQRVALTSAVIAIASIGVATAAIVWACDTVADANRARRALAPAAEPVAAPAPVAAPPADTP